MLVNEIVVAEEPAKPPYYNNGRPPFVQRIQEHRVLQQQQKNQPQQGMIIAGEGGAPKIIPIGWEKHRFNMFVAQHSARFKVNDLVAFASNPSREGWAPPLYRVEYVEEMFHLAKWDLDLGQPQIFLIHNIVLPPLQQGQGFFVSPQRIRLATEAEKQHANASNSTKPTIQ